MPKINPRDSSAPPPATSGQGSMPINEPPVYGEGGQSSSGIGISHPRNLTASELAMASGSSGPGGTAAPTMEPPDQTNAAGGSFMVMQNDKRIASLWSISENRNSWVNIAGIGWKRLSTSSDSAVVALTMVATAGKQTQTRVDYREESDNLIHELYVW